MTHAGDLTPTQAWQKLRDDPDAVLIDVRTEPEWDAVGVPDTSSLGREPLFDEWVLPTGAPNPEFLTRLAEAGVKPGDGRTLIFLCRTGHRSVAAAEATTAAGFGPSYNVQEGFEGPVPGSGWKARGLAWATRTQA